MLLYECPSYQANLTYLNKTERCGINNWNMPIDCYPGAVLFGWGVGGHSLHLPKHVGIPIGGMDGIKYALMEVHYDNQQKIKNITDNSGFKIYYTNQTRANSAGVIEMGMPFF